MAEHEMVADEPVSKDTYPDFTLGPERSREVVKYCSVGPEEQVLRALAGSNAGLAVAYGVQPKKSSSRVLDLNWTFLTALPFHNPRPAAQPNQPTPFTIKVHFRVLDPKDLKRLASETQLDLPFIINTATTPTATLSREWGAKYATRLTGDTGIEVSMTDSCDVVLGKIFRATAAATALREALNTGSKRDCWAWAVFAQCGLVSERVTAASWEMLKACLEGGGWWISVYLVETRMVAKGGSWHNWIAD